MESSSQMGAKFASSSSAPSESPVPSVTAITAQASGPASEEAAARIADMPDIFAAAEKGDLELLKGHCIVDAGCIQKTDRHGFTALHYSCKFGRLPVCKFLVHSKANLDAKDNFGWTPLHRACFTQGHNLELATFLVESKANVAARDNSGQTPLKCLIDDSERTAAMGYCAPDDYRSSPVYKYLRGLGAPES